MAKRDDDTAIKHGAALTQDAVGDPTAGQIHQVDHGGIEAINRACFSYVEAETALIYAGDHEQDEQRSHPVVAEALPHFREEKRGEAAGMAEEALVLAGWSLAFPEGGGHGCNSIISGDADEDAKQSQMFGTGQVGDLPRGTHFGCTRGVRKIK